MASDAGRPTGRRRRSPGHRAGRGAAAPASCSAGRGGPADRRAGQDRPGPAGRPSARSRRGNRESGRAGEQARGGRELHVAAAHGARGESKRCPAPNMPGRAGQSAGRGREGEGAGRASPLSAQTREGRDDRRAKCRRRSASCAVLPGRQQQAAARRRSGSRSEESANSDIRHPSDASIGCHRDRPSCLPGTPEVPLS